MIEGLHLESGDRVLERSASGLERRHVLTRARFVRLHGRYGFPSRP
jgi:hypothetical protein